MFFFVSSKRHYSHGFRCDIVYGYLAYLTQCAVYNAVLSYQWLMRYCSMFVLFMYMWSRCDIVCVYLVYFTQCAVYSYLTALMQLMRYCSLFVLFLYNISLVPWSRCDIVQCVSCLFIIYHYSHGLDATLFIVCFVSTVMDQMLICSLLVLCIFYIVCCACFFQIRFCSFPFLYRIFNVECCAIIILFSQSLLVFDAILFLYRVFNVVCRV